MTCGEDAGSFHIPSLLDALVILILFDENPA